MTVSEAPEAPGRAGPARWLPEPAIPDRPLAAPPAPISGGLTPLAPADDPRSAGASAARWLPEDSRATEERPSSQSGEAANSDTAAGALTPLPSHGVAPTDAVSGGATSLESARAQSAVRAYCREICDPGRVGQATEQTLGAFEIVNGSLEGSEAELVRHTRLTAARHAPTSVVRHRSGFPAAEHDDECDATPTLLARRANGEQSADEDARFASHLERCRSCHASELKAARADRAFAATLATAATLRPVRDESPRATSRSLATSLVSPTFVSSVAPSTTAEGQDQNGVTPEGLIVVTGGGGFIGGHLVRRLCEEGHGRVRAVDLRPIEEWHQVSCGAENLVLDLRRAEACDAALAGVATVYNLAADMGGMGFLETNKARCMLSVLINTQLLEAARHHDIERYFFSSSACVYAADKQLTPNVEPLKESDAYPAAPEDGYGWEKLFSERMCRHFTQDFGLTTRVARYHNVYGPHGTWTGGREKAPAAICRKIAEAEISGQHEIEIWGDGEQTRSFMYVDDCVHGTRKVMASDIDVPINLGSSEIVTINGLVDLVEEIAGVKLTRHYDLDAPTGVRGRNSDNAMIRECLGWEPSVPLQDGLERTYRWIYDQLSAALARVG